ncbi:MAG: type III-B CRISPR module RAMP protein Cmr4 [Candidatus Jordarchaeales archaeon]
MGEKPVFIPSAYEMIGVAYFWCETEFFPGGEREAGPVDLTVQRNFKGLPYVRGSSIKGALRSFYELNDGKSDAEVLFGSAEQAGCLVVENAEIIAFPVKADVELFVYVTSPSQVSAYVRDVSKFGVSLEEVSVEGSDKALSATLSGEIELMDEKYKLKLEKNEKVSKLASEIAKHAIPKVDGKPAPGYSYLKQKLEKLIVVDDTLFREIVNSGLVITLRIALNRETKTVAEKALFYQELIPEGTLFYAPIMRSIRSRCRKENDDKIKSFLEKLSKGLLINLGGDETTGKGVVRIVAHGVKGCEGGSGSH